VRRVRKLGRKIEKRFDEDNVLESKTTQDYRLSLQFDKRLKNCLLCEGGFPE